MRAKADPYITRRNFCEVNNEQANFVVLHYFSKRLIAVSRAARSYLRDISNRKVRVAKSVTAESEVHINFRFISNLG